jgi:UDP-2,3-diacylglucosamine pyrophosphatase LpxH
MKILFVSDLHLGDGSAADDFGDNDVLFFSWVNTCGRVKITPDKVIVVGDLYERWQFKYKRIKKAHPKLCGFFESSFVDYVIGNHDYSIRGKNSIKFTTKSGKEVLVVHGHQGDKNMGTPLIRGLVWCLGIIERIPGLHWIDNPEEFVKKQHEKAIESTEKYVTKQLEKGYDIVIAGHTHKIGIKNICTSNMLYPKTYINTGSCMGGNFQGILLDTETDTIEVV